MKSKKGELTTNELLEIILVVAGIVLLAVFFYSLVSPMWDKGDETSKAYLESLMSQIETADDGGVGQDRAAPARWDQISHQPPGPELQHLR